MSASYYIYTEVCLNEKWISVCPYIRNVEKDKLVMSETHYSGSRSYFSETFDKLREIGGYVDKTTVSRDISERHGEGWNNDNYLYVISVDYAVFKQYAPKNGEKQFHGFVSKNDIFSFEHGDCDDLWEYLTAKEYKKLSSEEKKFYDYYEWDSFDSWYYNFGLIKKSADKEISDF